MVIILLGYLRPFGVRKNGVKIMLNGHRKVRSNEN